MERNVIAYFTICFSQQFLMKSYADAVEVCRIRKHHLQLAVYVNLIKNGVSSESIILGTIGDFNEPARLENKRRQRDLNRRY